MVDVAEELGVDAIGLNHLMFSTPEEVAETVRLIGAADASAIATFVTAGSRARRRAVQRQVAALEEKCRRKNVLFDFRPKVHPQLIDNYYTPGAKLEGRCLYPFLHARVSFSGKVYFCPFIRVEVGDLDDIVARGDLERRALRARCAASWSSTASFRSAGAAARWSCRRVPVAEPFGPGVAATTRGRSRLTVVR